MICRDCIKVAYLYIIILLTIFFFLECGVEMLTINILNVKTEKYWYKLFNTKIS